MKAASIARIALFTALTAVLSQISIPLPFTPIPLSLSTLGGLTAAFCLSLPEAFLSQLTYLLLGLAGVPVFANFTATAKIAGPTGGYLVGYLFMALTTAFFLKILPSSFPFFFLACALGTAACYLFGTIWYMIYAKVDLTSALLLCVVPFLPGDGIKCAVLMLSGKKLQSLSKKASLSLNQ